jgi:hypothetical protein
MRAAVIRGLCVHFDFASDFASDDFEPEGAVQLFCGHPGAMCEG